MNGLIKKGEMMKRYFLILLSLSLMVWSAVAKAQSQTMSDYTKYPVFSTKTVTPNILIIYGLYYETGTAYGGYQDGDDMFMGIMDDGKAVKAVDLGVGKASAVGLHLNRRGGGNRKGKAFIQQSSGMIRELQVPTVFSLQGGLRGWHQ